MSIVENIQSLCEERGISIPKLEKELGFGKGAIYKWDKSSPSIDKMLKVARYFNVTIDKILGGINTELSERVRLAVMELTEGPYHKRVFRKGVVEILSKYLENVSQQYKIKIPVVADEILNLIYELSNENLILEILRSLEMTKEEIDKRSQPETIAAHHDGEDWTKEELEEIERFKEFIRMKRRFKQQKQQE